VHALTSSKSNPTPEALTLIINTTPSVPNVVCFGKSRYIFFIMHLDKYYV
jgi:hypothetical protein